MKHIKKMKAGAIVISGDSVYIVYRKRFDDYSFPKGRMEIGETLEQTALREILEETGVIGEIKGYIDYISYSFVENKICYDCEVHYFLMAVKEDKKAELADDVDSISLVKISDLEKRLSYKEDQYILQAALSKYPEMLGNKI